MSVWLVAILNIHDQSSLPIQHYIIYAVEILSSVDNPAEISFEY